MLIVGVVTCLVLTTVLSQAQEASSQPNGQPCDFCKQVVSNLDMFLQKNATEAELEKFIRKICSTLPQSMQQMCVDAVQQYGPLIDQILLQELQPDEVCTALGLCSTNEPDADSQEVSITEPVKVGDKCSFCAIVIPEMVNVLRDQYTLDAVQDALNNSCQLLSPTDSNVCQAMVSQYTTIVLEILMQQLQHQDVCSQLGLCNVSLTGSVNEIQLPGTDGIKCSLCELVIDKLKSMVGNNATKEKIKAALGKVCLLLPSKYRMKCTDFIDKYTQKIMDLLLSALSSEKICSVLGFCSEVFVNEIQPLSKGSIKCELCTKVLDNVTSKMRKKATANVVKKVLTKVCNFLPGLKFLCKTFVDKYTSKLIEWLLSSKSTKDICTKIKMCKRDEQNVEVSTNEIQPPSTDNIQCTLCKLVIDKLKSMLSDHATEDEIKAALKKVCGLVESRYRKKCTKFIDQYEQQIIKMLLSAFSSEQICKALTLCSADVEVSTNEIQPPSTDSSRCTLCKLVIDKLKSTLSDHTTEDEIKAALKKVCDLVEFRYKKKCTKFIAQYEQQIIKMLLSAFSSEQICKELKLCSADVEDKSGSLMFVSDNKELESTFEGEGKCEVCKMLADMIDYYIQKEKTVTEIGKILAEVCFIIIPEAKRPQCLSVVLEYTPALIELLSQLNNPTAVCEAVKVCARPSQETFPSFELL